jgi:hypothetical protein
MSLMDSIFGAGMGHIGGALGGMQSPPQYSNSWYNQQGLANAYSAAQQQAFTPPKWVLNGVHYHSVADFATAVFGDTPARTMFLLKYEEKK